MIFLCLLHNKSACLLRNNRNLLSDMCKHGIGLKKVQSRVTDRVYVPGLNRVVFLVRTVMTFVWGFGVPKQEVPVRKATVPKIEDEVSQQSLTFRRYALHQAIIDHQTAPTGRPMHAWICPAWQSIVADSVPVLEPSAGAAADVEIESQVDTVEC